MEVNIINATYDVVDEIKSSKEYQRLVYLSRYINENEDIQSLIKAFKKAETKYNDAKKYGKYHPDLKKIKEDLQVAKVNLYTNDIVEELKTLEGNIQKQLDNVAKSIATSISKKVKYPEELGLINRHKGGKHG